MSADPKMFQEVRSFLQRQQLDANEKEEQNSVKFEVQSGARRAYVSVFNTGKINVQGQDSPLKDLLLQMKEGLEQGKSLPGDPLPFEIERFPETIKETVPECDPVVVEFIREAIVCFKAEATLAAAFMLGAASEKAINLLIQTYADSIIDEINRDKFKSRLNNRMISTRYKEFEESYRGCKSRPTEPALAQDVETLIGQMFQFCRITRNEVGHPQIVPDLAKGVVLSNLGQFVHYIKRVYGLMAHFKDKGVTV